MKNLLLTLAAIMFMMVAASAQQIFDDEDIQSWNDVQLSVPLAPKVDLCSALTLRFGKNAARLNDGRLAFGITWKPLTELAITPFYWKIEARNARGEFRREHRLNLRATFRFPVKGFGLSHRSTYEFRMRPPANSWRYRGSLNFEKEIPERVLPKTKLLIGNEVFMIRRPEDFHETVSASESIRRLIRPFRLMSVICDKTTAIRTPEI